VSPQTQNEKAPFPRAWWPSPNALGGKVAREDTARVPSSFHGANPPALCHEMGYGKTSLRRRLSPEANPQVSGSPQTKLALF